MPKAKPTEKTLERLKPLTVERADHGVLPTGVPLLDQFIFTDISGNPLGGIPRGGVYELWGKQGSGKSRLAYEIIRAEQETNEDAGVVLVDAEGVFSLSGSTDYLSFIGVNVDSVLTMRSDDEVFVLESVFADICEIAKAGVASMVVIDSLAMLVPSADRQAFLKSRKSDKEETSFAAGTRGVFASATLSSLKQTVPLCLKYGLTVIFVNHLRDTPDMFGAQYAPGGNAKNHLLNASLKLTRDDLSDGIITSKVKVTKCKVSPTEGLVSDGKEIPHIQLRVGIGVEDMEDEDEE